MTEKNFEGIVKVYNQEFYVNTNNGVGLDSVLKKIDPLLSMKARKAYLPGYSFEDIKQELTCIAIDGIRAYDPDKGAVLSTFLHGHIDNKFISKLRSENKQANDAFFLKSNSADGNVENSEDAVRFRKAREELSFSQCTPANGDEELLFEDTLASDDGLYTYSKDVFNDINFKISLDKLTDGLDEKTSKIIDLVFKEDYSIKDAAHEVGLSGWAASMRLKNLSKRKIFKEAFNKVE
jgi:RNA polymerase sigma factor (sigma-70 family)